MFVRTGGDIILGVDGVPTGRRHPNGSHLGMSILWHHDGANAEHEMFRAFRSFVGVGEPVGTAYTSVFEKWWEETRDQYSARHADYPVDGKSVCDPVGFSRSFEEIKVGPLDEETIPREPGTTDHFAMVYARRCDANGILDVAEGVAACIPAAGSASLVIATDDADLPAGGSRTYVKPDSRPRWILWTVGILVACVVAALTAAGDLVGTGLGLFLSLALAVAAWSQCARYPCADPIAVADGERLKAHALSSLRSMLTARNRIWSALTLVFTVLAMAAALIMQRSLLLALLSPAIVLSLGLHAAMARLAAVPKCTLSYLLSRSDLLAGAATWSLLSWGLTWAALHGASSAAGLQALPNGSVSALAIALVLLLGQTCCTAVAAARADPSLATLGHAGLLAFVVWLWSLT